MHDWQTTLLLETVERLFKRELEPVWDALDDEPHAGLPAAFLTALADVNLFDTQHDDPSASSPLVSVEILLAAAARCPTYAAVLAMSLMSSVLGQRCQVAMPGARTALCLWEPGLLAPTDFEVRLLPGGRVSGVKTLAPFVRYADMLAITCMTDDGVRLAWVERRQAGVQITLRDTLGLRVLGHADVVCDEAAIRAEAALPAGDLLALLDSASLYTSAAALGAAVRALDVASAYAAQRYQGGRMISDYDPVRLLLGENSAAVNAAIGALRSMTATAETARRAGDAMRLKAHAARVAVNAASAAIQVLGGYGYLRSYGQERRFRDIATLALEPLDPTRSLLWADALTSSAAA